MTSRCGGRDKNDGRKGRGRGHVWGSKENFGARWRGAKHAEEDRRVVRARGLGPCMPRWGFWTEVANFRATNPVAVCRVAWMRYLPGQEHQAEFFG